MKTLIRVFALGMPLILGCWTARSATTNAVLTFHIVSEKKIGDGRFIDTPILPKVGYIRSSPDMVVTNLQGVYSQKDADYYTLVQPDGSLKKVPSHMPPSLAVQLNTEDAHRLSVLTEQAENKRLLVMLGNEPLMAPTVVAPITGGSFTIGFRSQAELKNAQRDLKKLIHDPSHKP